MWLGHLGKWKNLMRRDLITIQKIQRLIGKSFKGFKSLQEISGILLCPFISFSKLFFLLYIILTLIFVFIIFHTAGCFHGSFYLPNLHCTHPILTRQTNFDHTGYLVKLSKTSSLVKLTYSN